MYKLGLMWRERQSNSRFIESVWKSSTPVATSRTAIADHCISISLVKNKNELQVVVTGPKTKPHRMHLASGYVCTTIRLKPGVFFKGVSTQKLANNSLTFPTDLQSRFWFKGVCLQFPDFNQAELLIDELYRWDLLGYENLSSDQTTGRLSFRTHSRHIQRITGLSPYQFYQLERIHKALRLLKQDMSAVDVAAELAFVDQPHLIRASKQFLGHTPKQFANLPQVP